MNALIRIKNAAPVFVIALSLVTLPARLLTVTANKAPLSAAVVGGVVYDALVAPIMFAPFFVH